MMRILTTIGLLAGLAAATLLVTWQGFGTIGGALASLGAGLLLLPLAFLPHLVLAAWSWDLLFAHGRAPGFATALRAMWMGLSVDMLLPLASIGGEVVKVRVLMRARVAGKDAGASVVVDKTVQAISLVLWGLIGIAVLVWIEADRELVAGALIASALLAAGIAGFVFVQRAGTFAFLARVLGKTRAAGAVTAGAVELDGAIRALYGQPRRILLAVVLRLLSRLALTAEVWLAAHLMGVPITPWDALMLKSLTGALRGAASLPGLVAWQHGEGRALWQRLASGGKR
jgi:hypothetical protein